MKILLIEDDDLDARQILRNLRRLTGPAHHIIREVDLKSGLNAIRQSLPDVILADLGLPDCTGLETVAKLVSMAGERPVIVLTGAAESDQDLSALARGAADFLIKGSITQDHLERALRYALERTSAHRQLRRQAALLNQTHEGILSCTPEGRITYENQGARNLLEIGDDVVCNANLFGLLRMSGSDVDRLHLKLKERGFAEVETLLELPRRPAKHLLSRWSMTEDHEDGSLLIVVLSDVTERVVMDQKLRDTQKLESLGVLAGGIAHDFNNLLAVMMGNVSMVLADQLLPSAHRDKLRDVEKATVRAADLCRMMLAYAGKGKFVLTKLDFHEQVRELTHLLESSVSKSVHVRIELGALRSYVLAERSQMNQLIMNLVINASDAIGHAEGFIVVATTNREVIENDIANTPGMADLLPGRYLCFSVTDTGCGMSEETLEKIFDPFFTTKFTGRGLGLAAVQGIVRGHKGSMLVRSVEGSGTTFDVLLPVEDDLQGGEHGPRTLEITHSVRPEGGTLLLVDDEVDVRATTRSILEAFGYEVIEAADGEKAIQLFQEHRDQLKVVLLDVSMPRMNGVEACLKLHEISVEVPVILMSGHAEEATMSQIETAGKVLFLQKPFFPAELNGLVQKVIQEG